MQEAIPFRTYIPATTTGNRRLPARDQSSGGTTSNVLMVSSGDENCVKRLVLENSVIVFGKKGCCMCHVVKKLLLGLGVNPTVIEVDENEEATVVKELSTMIDGEEEVQFPVVFVGGKLFGGLERVMATHISGELVPILKDARALWL